MDIGHLVTLLRGTLQPDERAEAEKQLIEVCRTCSYLCDISHFNTRCSVGKRLRLRRAGCLNRLSPGIDLTELAQVDCPTAL